MAKAIIIYESRWGNTRLVAEKIAEGIRQVPGSEADVVDVKNLDTAVLRNYDGILLGSPNHLGGATRNIGNLTGKLGQANLDGKIVSVFDTYMAGDFQKTVRKLEKMISQKAPGIKLITPGLSVKVTGMKGPLSEGELPRCLEFGSRIAALLKDERSARQVPA